MSRPILLRTFVNERLSAAAEEIIQVFESAIAKYEEEASSSKQENERLRGLLQEVMSKQKAGTPSVGVRLDQNYYPKYNLHYMCLVSMSDQLCVCVFLLCSSCLLVLSFKNTL